jgi:hypothetical protein
MRVSVAMLALAACAPAPRSMYAPNPDIDGPVIVRVAFGHVDGVVIDRVTGERAAEAAIIFDDRDDGTGIMADDDGHYTAKLRVGRASAAIIYGENWMIAEPFDVTAAGTTTHDFVFSQQRCTPDADTVDRVFKRVLVERFGGPHRRDFRLVDMRAKSAGNSVSIAGIDLTTIDALEDESDRSHKTIWYAHIDARLVNSCTVIVSFGKSCVTPHELLSMCDEGSIWMYGKTATGWRRIGLVTNYAT